MSSPGENIASAASHGPLSCKRLRSEVPAEDASHVVVSPGGIGEVDELLAGRLEIFRVQKQPLNLVVGEHGREPIGAEQKEICVQGIELEDVDLDGVLHAQRSNDDVLVGERLHLLGG